MKIRFSRKLLAICLICLISLAGYMEISSAAEPSQQDRCELVIETVTFGLDNPGLSMVEEAVNQITEPAIGVRIRLLDIGIGQHAQLIGQKIANGEQIDLVMVGITYPMNRMVSDELLMPLDELLDMYGSSLKSIFGDKMAAGTLSGVQYAIPAKLREAYAGGLVYNKTMAQEAGITMPDPCSPEELDSVMNQVKEAFPDVYGTAYITREVSLLNFLYQMETYGSGSYAYGVTFDPWESTMIENVFASEQYLEFCRRTRRWQEQGLLPPNLMTSSILPSDRLDNGQIFCLFTGYSPETNSGELHGPVQDIVRLSDPINTTDLMQERMWGIPVTSAHPEKALEFLNLLFTNADLANLLTNGIEGIHYTRVSEHVIDHTDGPAYQRIFTIFGDQRTVAHWVPATEETRNEMVAFEELVKDSLTLGYTFDTRPVEREVEAVNQIISLYEPALECGLIEDVESAVAQLNQELEKAGIERIIEENRRQLSVWLSEQGH